VAIKTSFGTFVRAAPGSDVDSQLSDSVVLDLTLLHLNNGRVGIRTPNKNYVTAVGGDPGRVGDISWLKSWETFEMIKNSDGTVSFKTEHGTYLTASPLSEGGRILARNGLRDSAKFTIIEDQPFAVVREEKVAIQTVFGTYVRSLPNSGIDVGSSITDQAKFSLQYLKNGKVALKTANNTYVCAPPEDSAKVIIQTWLNTWESFTMIENCDGSVTFRTTHGGFLRANFGGDGSVITTQSKADLGSSTRFKIVRLETA